ncbi:GGDEF domain-containing protein [Arenimonas fontis]|uniref:diguanylate cyclase n=1 Tax=Arenimonas fontis TaxID=2608255 RepID=A0A5B2ZDH0_9GAMM|nr:GGDEF domain-containing protein [Arenimonas fontis]KAA2285071.1 GGDEF domain-containing protein [Arenimonas fontis]
MSTSSTLYSRLRGDLRLSMITLFGALTFVGIAPFVAIRASRAEWLAAGLDAGMMLIIAGSVAYVWRTGRTELVGSINAVVVSLVCAVLTGLLGEAGHFWTYTALAANFMLAPRWLAAACCAVLLSAQLWLGSFSDLVAAAAFLTSALLVTLFAAVFVGLSERQHRQLLAMATLDPLTGAPNRRALEVELPEAVQHHRQRAEPMALAVLDLDHFKRINDRHGHEIGDRVLVDLVARIQGVLRKRDRLFRLGGEEFVLLLPATSAGGARAALEKVRRAVEAQPMGPDLRATVSVGVAMLAAEDDWPSLLARADEAMYEAKRRGRNQVRMYPPSLLAGDRRGGNTDPQPLPATG